MSRHPREQLDDFALGLLSEVEARALSAHLADCRDCAAEVRAAREALAGYGQSLAPLAPSPGARARLLAAVGAPLALDVSEAQVAAFFDLPEPEIRPLLLRASDERAFLPGPVLGMRVLPLQPGPRHAGAAAWLVRLAGDLRFPAHEHLGAEHTLLFAGGVTLDDGRRLAAPAELSYAPGTRHAFTVDPEGCVHGLVLHAGTVIDGIGPVRVGPR